MNCDDLSHFPFIQCRLRFIRLRVPRKDEKSPFSCRKIFIPTATLQNPTCRFKQTTNETAVNECNCSTMIALYSIDHS